MTPSLELVERSGVRYWADARLLTKGVIVAFTSRRGGVSEGPYSELNLARHVGDQPEAVDENRSRVMRVLGIEDLRSRLTCAEQVHGAETVIVDEHLAGAGAFAAEGAEPVPGADALVTQLTGTPLALFFADCVPVVLVAPRAAAPGVAVVHAGWRGALSRLPGKAAAELAEKTSCEPSELLAYVGPHICAEHYEVSGDLLWRFADSFDTIAAAPEPRGRPGPLDLGAAVLASLSEVGVPPRNILHAGMCTYECEDSFYSYRRSATTGRQSALACILERPSR